uniref:Uncharacterized protein n=1 Tax=Odontella aurita TaxID=265563 RepID=A0A7S4MSR5_9STRA|mmetsp:Transcript_30753/g.92130  ORF Transcript_30753/g.92130 Transcript_30753/m.92130 type:complete len:871 (+) Transcript_30753:171-2783(+)
MMHTSGRPAADPRMRDPYRQRETAAAMTMRTDRQGLRAPPSPPAENNIRRGLPPPPSPASYYAALFARRRLASAAFLPSLSTLCLPPALLGLHSALSTVTADHALFGVALAASVVTAVLGLIRKYAPNEEEADAAVAMCRVRLPLAAVAVSAALCRWVIDPLDDRFGDYFRWDSGGRSPAGDDAGFGGADAVALGARMALGMAALSAAVMWRYIGWFSVVQCSSVPVQSNPFENIASTLRSSPETIIDMIFGPDPRRIISKSGNHRSSGNIVGSRRTQWPRPRYARPTLMRCVAQFAAHAIAGTMFAVWTAIPLLSRMIDGDDDVAKVLSTELAVTCLLGSAITATLTLLADGTSHEIKFRRRSAFASSTLSVADTARSVFLRTADEIQRRSLYPNFIFTPFVVHAATVLFAMARPTESLVIAGDRLQSSILGILSAIVPLIIATATVSMYLVFTDVLVRRFLSTPHVDIDRLVYVPNETAEAVPFLPEDLIIQLLLRDCDRDGELVRSIVAPRATAHAPGSSFLGGSFLEEEEVRRNDTAAMEVARSMVPLETEPEEAARLPPFGFASGSNYAMEGKLEEDLLKVVVLETLGGDEVGGPTDAHVHTAEDELRKSLGLSQRHFNALKRRVLMSDMSSAEGRNIQQPVIIPLIRALCSYAGGMGEALVRCGGEFVSSNASQGYVWGVGAASEQQRLTGQQPSWLRGTWSLPPGAAACAEYSILAAARLVVMNLRLRTRGNLAVIPRRHSWVSLLIPSVLHSAFRLRCGCLAYAKDLMMRSDAPRPAQDASGKVRRGDGVAGVNASGMSDAGTVEGLGVFIARYCLDVQHVLRACDDAAVLLLRTLTDLDGPRDANVKVHDGCKAWLNGLLS